MMILKYKLDNNDNDEYESLPIVLEYLDELIYTTIKTKKYLTSYQDDA